MRLNTRLRVSILCLTLLVSQLDSLNTFAEVMEKNDTRAQLSKQQNTPKKDAQIALNSVTDVDLARYAGEWYEIALIPNFFQRNCIKNVKATYTLLDNGQIDVINACQTQPSTKKDVLNKNGKIITVHGRAKLQNKSASQLKVTFLNFFGWRYLLGGDYWIIQLAKNYSYAVIGEPKRKYGWVLSKSPDLPVETLAEIASKLKEQGYSPENFIMSSQDLGVNFSALGITNRPSLTTYLMQAQNQQQKQFTSN